ncbi:MAG: DUF3800 domain-containing protein [Desulfovibrionaceae bacterium]|nr:DUF3800 domain-containing protein [Desulfovibrionaceae bacterium]
MGYFLFIDESGHDRKYAPYEVLAGLCVEDREIWNLIQGVWSAEERFFGQRVTDGFLELKGKKLLKKKTFSLAGQLSTIAEEERRELARACLLQGDGASRRQLTALGQAKLAFVEHLLELCSQHRAKVFASLVDVEAERPEDNYLRKDYSFLFERFFYFLEDQDRTSYGVVVFDELDKSKSHILVDQMSAYFQKTIKGRMRASRIIPEPFFVHSDLTTLIQLTDIVAYILSWGVRFGAMAKPARAELARLAEFVLQLRHWSRRQVNGQEDFVVWSLTHISDLRPLEQQQ